MLLSVKPGLHTKGSGSENNETGFITMDSKDGKASSLETVTAEPLISAAVPAAEVEFTGAEHGSPKHETLVPYDHHVKSLQTVAAVEDTRLIPVRPITPFTATRGSDEFIEERDEHLFLSTAPHQDPVSV